MCENSQRIDAFRWKVLMKLWLWNLTRTSRAKLFATWQILMGSVSSKHNDLCSVNSTYLMIRRLLDIIRAPFYLRHRCDNRKYIYKGMYITKLITVVMLISWNCHNVRISLLMGLQDMESLLPQSIKWQVCFGSAFMENGLVRIWFWKELKLGKDDSIGAMLMAFWIVVVCCIITERWHHWNFI